MWKLLIAGFVWMGILFGVELTRSAFLKRLTVALIVTAAVYTAALDGVDPYAWAYYTGFSLAALWIARQFRAWVFARAIYLDTEVARLGHRRTEAARSLSIKTREAERLGHNASEIAYVYDKIRELSQSLDVASAFVVLGEAAAKIFDFEWMKLAVFNDHQPEAALPIEVYALRRGQFSESFDRTSFLKDRSQLKGDTNASDRDIFEQLFRTKKIVTRELENGRCDIARAVLIDGQVFAALIISDVPKAQLAILAILAERFASEIERVRLYERIQALAVTDGLTGVYVRRHLLERFEGELERSRRLGFKLSFLMIDIDHFKSFNDEYGHLVGDAVLKQAAETIRKSVRELDLVGRYGGEEFGVLLVETDEAGAFYVADRIRRAVGQRAFKVYDENLKVTVSIGVATYSNKLNSSALLIDAADSALYQAKRGGRNKVCVFA